ncbi:hypothetical protein M011DRAFT_166253 [Sporormia fimetaria CBS 119925]|uniref:Uncharacterized protein n=1 Tax=Sporormia fimetaria CBS 119925 TaxID=1340428 RepID=A0A6A6V1R4_9PLEO|nr:hypothetical protein M011DRAFT_166253 [Sporormia fimetaria CBS 119925]
MNTSKSNEHIELKGTLRTQTNTSNSNRSGNRHFSYWAYHVRRVDGTVPDNPALTSQCASGIRGALMEPRSLCRQRSTFVSPRIPGRLNLWPRLRLDRLKCMTLQKGCDVLWSSTCSSGTLMELSPYLHCLRRSQVLAACAMALVNFVPHLVFRNWFWRSTYQFGAR